MADRSAGRTGRAKRRIAFLGLLVGLGALGALGAIAGPSALSWWRFREALEAGDLRAAAEAYDELARRRGRDEPMLMAELAGAIAREAIDGDDARLAELALTGAVAGHESLVEELRRVQGLRGDAEAMRIAGRLAALGDQDATAELRSVLATDHLGGRRSRVAAELLAPLGDPAALAWAREEIASGRAWPGAFPIVGELGDASDLPLLERAIRRPRSVCEALRALGRLGARGVDPGRIRAILTRRLDPETTLPVEAIYAAAALVAVGDDLGVETLRRIVPEGSAGGAMVLAEDRLHGAIALDRASDPLGIALLIDMVGSGPARPGVLRWLAVERDPPRVELLREHLDVGEDVAADDILLLGEVGDVPDLRFLRRFLRSDRPYTATSAAVAALVILDRSSTRP